MNVLGLSITRTKHVSASAPVSARGGWWPLTLEAFAGAWQRNIEVDRQDVMAYGAVWACMTLIAADISKLWIKLVEKDEDGICSETESAAFSPVLRKPNHFQTRVKFFESWILAKLQGNAYILKERDHRGLVTALYVLDSSRVQVLVAPDGSVFYQLGTDYLSGVGEASVTVPAREIIHDVMVPLYHPLVGISPIYACGLAAMQGLKIQQNSAKFFANGLQLGGVLTAPGNISTDTAKRLEDHWNAHYAGEQNVGRIAALGDGLKFEPMTSTAMNAQLIEQLKWTAENVCACFHVPGYMVGIGPPPPYTDIQSINLQYYTQALQNPIENLEILLAEGLELPKKYAIEFDLDALARMDTKTQVENATKGIAGGLWSPNEARAKFDYTPVAGGDAVYLQQQQYSLAALDRRDQMAPAPPTAGPDPPPIPAPSATRNVPAEFSAVLLEKFAAVDWTSLDVAA